MGHNQNHIINNHIYHLNFLPKSDNNFHFLTILILIISSLDHDFPPFLSLGFLNLPSLSIDKNEYPKSDSILIKASKKHRRVSHFKREMAIMEAFNLSPLLLSFFLLLSFKHPPLQPRRLVNDHS